MYKKLCVCNVCLNARGAEGKSLYLQRQQHKILIWALWAYLGTTCALGHMSLTLLWQG